MRRVLYLLPVVAFLVVAGYFADALFSGRDPQALPSAMIDKPAPVFSLTELNGGAPVSNDTFKGQVAVVNFFASWCVPCRVEHPILMHLAESEHLPIYGIVYKDKPDAAIALLTQMGNPYTVIGRDDDGRVAIDFGVYGVPETYVIDREGRIRFRYAGPLTAEVVRTKLLPLLKELDK